MSNHGSYAQQNVCNSIGCECILFCNVERPTAPPIEEYKKESILEIDRDARISIGFVLELSSNIGILLARFLVDLLVSNFTVTLSLYRLKF